MITGKAGKDLIKLYEGLPKQNKDGLYPPYICPAGYPTLGYGSRYQTNGAEVTMKDAPVSLTEAENILNYTLKTYESAVNSLVTVPLTQNQFDALVSFVYNLGAANLKSSTLLRKLNARDYKGAADQFLVWNKARVNGVLQPLNGLTKRRTSERDLFLK